MEFSFNPDRERFLLTLVMGTLVNGRTIIENTKLLNISTPFVNALSEFGLSLQVSGEVIVLQGNGFQYPVPSLLKSCSSEFENVLLWSLASKDTNQIFTIYKEELSSIDPIKKYFKVSVIEETEEKYLIQFLKDDIPLKKDSLGNIPYLMRLKFLLRSLLFGNFLTFEEKSAVKDQWTKMLIYFGVPLRYEGRGIEQLSEFERRLLMAQGKKVERTQFTELSETKVITGRDYFVPGSFTEACAFILLMTINGVPKENKILLKNVELNLSRTGALNCLKRMGANIEVVTRREKYGDVYGDIEVFPLDGGKRLQGRRFAEETIASSVDEFPFLAVAACFAEGETILRLPKEDRESKRYLNEILAENLRKTGAEVGVYDDGLVIRGVENVLTLEDFTISDNPEIELALNVLLRSLGGNISEKSESIIEKKYPGILDKLKLAETIERTEEVV